jgi:hypothetical protein
VFGRGDKQPEHTITKSWRKGIEDHDTIQKLWSASCTCGWHTDEGNFLHVGRQVAAHELVIEQAGHEVPETAVLAGAI